MGEDLRQPIVGRDRRIQRDSGRARQLGRRLLAEGAEALGRTLEIATRGGVGVGQQAHHESDDHRVDPGLEDGYPQHRTEERVDQPVAHAQRADHQQQREHA
jgi:hypothetical protein